MPTAGRIFTLLSLLSACNRTDAAPGPGTAQTSVRPPEPAAEPAVATAPPAAASVTAAPSPPSVAASSEARAACVVPLAEPPPPQAKPASICPKEPTKPPKFERGYLSFKDAPKSPRLALEIARTPEAHEHGLMYRTKMPEEQGMLFEWGSDSRRIFWMHNTCLPLDMLFIAQDGTIGGILEQVPVLNDEPRTVPCLAGYVLEVNAGWCRRHGVKPGMHMTLE